MHLVRKHKAVVVVIFVFLCSFVFVCRYFLFYKAMYLGWFNQVKATELHAAVSTLIYNIELYIDEEQHSDPERTLRFICDNANQCEREIKQLTSFCSFVVTEKDNFWINERLEYHNKISVDSLSGLVRTSNDLSQRFRVFQGFLSHCMDNNSYYESDEQLKKDLSIAVQQLNALSNVLMEHDFREIEREEEFIACYLCFLDETDAVARDMFNDFES